MDNDLYIDLMKSLSEQYELAKENYSEANEESYQRGYSMGKIHGILCAIDLLNEKRK